MPRDIFPVHLQVHTRMFITELFTITKPKNWKQPKFPSIGGHMKKTLVCSQMGYLTAVKNQLTLATCNNSARLNQVPIEN